MDADQYSIFFQSFSQAATPIMQALRSRLMQMGLELGTFSEVEEMDHDIHRGLGFGIEGDFEESGEVPFVELLLTDGEDDREEGQPPLVGLKLECSILASGVVWCPGAFTSDAWVSTSEEIDDLLSEFDIDEVAERIKDHWREHVKPCARSVERPA